MYFFLCIFSYVFSFADVVYYVLLSTVQIFIPNIPPLSRPLILFHLNSIQYKYSMQQYIYPAPVSMATSSFCVGSLPLEKSQFPLGI